MSPANETIHLVDAETPPEGLVELRRLARQQLLGRDGGLAGADADIVCLNNPPEGDAWTRLNAVATVRRLPRGYWQEHRLRPLIAGRRMILCWSVSTGRTAAAMLRGSPARIVLRLTEPPERAMTSVIESLSREDAVGLVACNESIARALRAAGVGPVAVIPPPAPTVARAASRQAETAAGFALPWDEPVAPAAEGQDARAAACRVAVRERLGFSPEHILVIAPGPAHRRSGHREAIWATVILSVAEFPVRMVIPNADAGARGVDDFAGGAGFGHMIALAGAGVAEEDVLAAADVAVLVGRDEVPTVHLAEVLAAGLPLVAADVPSARDVLTDGDNALLVDPAGPRAIAAGLMRLIEQPALADRLSRGARAAAERFDSHRVAEAWEALRRQRGFAAGSFARSIH